MADGAGVGRVAIFDDGAGARRVMRALRELERAGHGARSVAVHGPADRAARFVREADEAVERSGSLEEALRAAGPALAWLGPAPLGARLAFTEACGRVGVRPVGPPAEALRRLVAPDGLLRLAAELGVGVAAAVPAEVVHLVEVVFVQQGGPAHLIGLADASLRQGGWAVLVESPPLALDAAGQAAARRVAQGAVAASGWEGLGVVRLHLDPATGRLGLAGLDLLADGLPAVEAMAGADLIRLALQLAAGARPGRLPVVAPGHAVAATLLSTDPEHRLPSRGGRVELLRLPGGFGIRCDAAVDQGDELPAVEARPLCTLVARGEDRAEATTRLEQALADADVLLGGSAGSKAWLAALCARPEVRAGRAGLGLLERLRATGERLVRPRPEVALVAAAIEAYDAEVELELARFLAEARRGRPRVGPSAGRTVELRHEGQRHELEVQQLGPGSYRVTPAGGAAVEVRVERLGRLERRLAWGDRRERVLATVEGLQHLVHVDGVAHAITREPAGLVVSPMPAVVVSLPVEVGQEVAAGDPVARIESMKVETVVLAPEAGIVRELLAAVNGQVDAGGPLLRLQPLGERTVAAAPLALAGGPAPEPPATPRGRYLAALTDLRRLLLGFDAPAPEARSLAAGWRDLATPVAGDDAEVVRAEDGALAIFGELEWLFTRARHRDGGPGAPPLEELWRYLHEPGARGAGLSGGFTAVLRRALSHYGVSMDAPDRDLELALLRIQKAHERVESHLGPVLGLLERRLSAGGVPPGLTGPGARDLLDQLVDVGQERFPGLADLARELRYRRFDQPAFDGARQAIYAQAEADLASLASAPAEEVEGLVERLVECPQPIATLLISRMASGPALRPRLVEALLRRYYRLRPLGPIATLEVEGTACATADDLRDGQAERVVACHLPAGQADQGARRLARAAAQAPAGREVVLEAYLWQEGPARPDDEQAEALRVLLEQAGFTRPVQRVSVVLATAGRGLGNQASQQHFTFRGGPAGFVEERRYRGVHFMMFERMQLGRLSKFDLTRLPSAEDVYLYRGVAQGNPKDERLFAAAEVRDLTPVRDAQGRVVQLPQLEAMLHEALAGMRRFQARRPANQRLEWNRVLLTVVPPLTLSRDEIGDLARRLLPSAQGLGLEMVLVHALVPDPASGRLAETLLRIVVTGRDDVSIRWDPPAERPLEPMAEYQQKVVQLRRRGLIHPFELVRLLAPPHGSEAGLPPGEFVEYDLDPAGRAVPVQRPPGQNTANVVLGVVVSFTPLHPEGMKRVILLGDPGREMGSVAEPECRRILAGLELAEALRVPLEWFEVCAGAKISMTTGTENMDWISAVLRKIIEFTQGGGELNVVVMGITVGAQPYWNAEATMLMHTRGILVMIPGASMVLTGKQALEYSGSVSAEDNEGIGGYDRIMGPNGQAQYQAGSAAEACQILMRHYQHSYLAAGERFPRRAPTTDPIDRDVRLSPHGPDGGAGFVTVGDVFSREKNPDRKKPFEIRRIMAACIDQDHPPLERWRDVRGGETGVVWDAHLGGWPVCLVGIQSRPLPRLEFVPADGPDSWSAGTLFPQSSKKIARAINAASGNRPLVVLANLSGFDGSPESMRRLQLEYGAEIGRAVVNFQGPIVFCVVSRYHGGAFVVFAKTLKEDMEVVAVEGARASVIGGAPAAAVVFAREVETRTRKDPRVVEAEQEAARGGGAARGRLAEVVAQVRSEKLGEVGDEFDGVHSVERALAVGSLDRILAAAELRPWLVAAVERGIARTLGDAPGGAPP